MRVSLVFTGFAPIASTLPAVHAAERHGLDGVWSAEHIGFHDAITPSLLYLRETERLEIGLVGFSPASRHPGLLAMEIASLAELAPGRIRVQVGTGDPSLVAKLGKPVHAPARSTATFVRSLREALAGSDMNVEHPDYAFRGFKLAPLAPAPPIDVMAVRPKMIETAARVGDGVSLSVGASRAYLRDTVAAIERSLAAQKKSRADFRVTALSLAVIAKDLDAARAMVVPLLAMGEPSMVEHLTRGVFAPGEVTAAAARGGPFALAKLFTPEAIDEIALVSTPDGLADSLGRYAETGIDELAVGIFAAPDELPAIVAELGRARSELREDPMTDDEKRIRELHAGFVEANTTGDVAFLRAHMVPGKDALTWFNLNQSNYVGVDHIVELWQFLSGVSAGRKAECKVSEERVTVSGDAAWVVYALDFRADFGAMGKVAQDARCTEIWQRSGGDWRMVHFHCSNHVPGQMGGL